MFVNGVGVEHNKFWKNVLRVITICIFCFYLKKKEKNRMILLQSFIIINYGCLLKQQYLNRYFLLTNMKIFLRSPDLNSGSNHELHLDSYNLNCV